MQGSYEKGRRTGTWQEFDENESLSCRTEYIEGAQTAQHWYFRGDEVTLRTEVFPDGTQRAQWTTYVKDGSEVRHGRQRTYYSNGTLAETGIWVNGKRDGIWKSFDEAGNPLTEETWKDGVKQ
jgi:antitoxin component YwqK of YwqJK toxin-antitoxin module